MLFPDVNVLVGAQRNDDSPHAAAMRGWLEKALSGPELIGVSELALSGMIRIVTHPRVFHDPSTPAQALAFCDALLSAPTVTEIRPGPRHWPLFRALVDDHRLRSNDVPDAYLAAMATEVGATVVTADRGFARFGIKTLDPTAPASG